MIPPTKIAAEGRLTVWLNKLLVFAISSRLVSVEGGRLIATPKGTRLIIQPSVGGSGSPPVWL